jgi:hypothetical protein
VGLGAAAVAYCGVAGLFAGVEFAVPEILDLEGSEEAFGRCVVPAIALAAHTADHACGLRRLALVVARMLAAAVGLVIEPSCRPSRSNEPAQRASHYVASDRLRNGPADDHVGTPLKNDRKIEPAIHRPDVAVVARPRVFAGSRERRWKGTVAHPRADDSSTLLP